jgi:methylated-DNA-[protein]-cysteine S-methyltransferase
MTYALVRRLPLLGRVRLVEADSALVRLDLEGKGALPPLPQAEERATPLLEAAAAQLADYLAGARRAFDLPLAPKGTDFQKKVWRALLAITYGETRAYKAIAAAVGSPRACRAVGLANNRNPIAVIIPCHRVIGADGRLGGYGGGLELKAALLRLEQEAVGRG